MSTEDKFVSSRTWADLYVTVPASEGEMARVEVEDAVDRVRGGSETILLVEDEPILLEMLQVLVESKGYRVITAADGEEAVSIYALEKEKIALVLSDMGLPRLGGWEALQKMKEINPKVKTILASGYLDAELRNDMLQAGAKDFVQKPYVPEIILQRIREVIDSP